MKHYVVYSHGFGVDKTDRGLLSEIAATMPEYEHILFDYNEVDHINNTLTVSPFQEQVKRLKTELEKLDYGEEKIIDIVAHSQGCIVAAIAKSANVRQVICLTPPDNVDADRIIDRFKNTPGSEIDITSVSKIIRSDGSTTLVPASYWKSIESLNVTSLYNHLSEAVKVTFIIAKEDDVLGMTNFDKINHSIDLQELSGDHNFTGGDRAALCKRVRDLLG